MPRCQGPKRNKKAKANKLWWQAKKKAEAAAAALKLFDEIPLPSSVPRVHEKPLGENDVAVVKKARQKRVRRPLLQKKHEALVKPNMKNQDDEGTSIGPFIKNIPNWGTEKYQAPKFLKRKHKLSGALEKDEDESNLRESVLEPDEDVNTLNDDVKTEIDLGLSEDVNTLTRDVKMESVPEADSPGEPNWGTAKYQAPKFIKRKHKLSALEQDEDESNLTHDAERESVLEPDEDVNTLNDDVKTEIDLGQGEDVNTLTHDMKIDSPVEENKMIGLKYMLDTVLKLQHDHGKICLTGLLSVESENREGVGLRSRVILVCEQCLKKYELLIDCPDPGMD